MMSLETPTAIARSGAPAPRAHSSTRSVIVLPPIEAPSGLLHLSGKPIASETEPGGLKTTDEEASGNKRPKRFSGNSRRLEYLHSSSNHATHPVPAASEPR
jgi:hypothetical protein